MTDCVQTESLNKSLSPQALAPGALCAGWLDVVAPFLASAEGRTLTDFLNARLAAGAIVYPPDPWRALRGLAPADVRVVILGQDPYHGLGQATGMAFAVPEALKRLPPSLKNIFAEVAREYGTVPRTSGDLSDWARQGVLLLNSSLTVEEGKPLAHAGRGWETLTDRLLLQVLEAARPVVFLLWGAWAQKKEALVASHAKAPVCILKANHPSPLSARRPPVPFIGCGHFAAANAWLKSMGREEIDWSGAAVKANGGPKARSEARTSAQAVGECLLHRQGELF